MSTEEFRPLSTISTQTEFECNFLYIAKNVRKSRFHKEENFLVDDIELCVSLFMCVCVPERVDGC